MTASEMMLRTILRLHLNGPVPKRNLRRAPMPHARRFPPPWSIEDNNDACFIVKDATGKCSRKHETCEMFDAAV